MSPLPSPALCIPREGSKAAFSGHQQGSVWITCLLPGSGGHLTHWCPPYEEWETHVNRTLRGTNLIRTPGPPEPRHLLEPRDAGRSPCGLFYLPFCWSFATILATSSCSQKGKLSGAERILPPPHRDPSPVAAEQPAWVYPSAGEVLARPTHPCIGRHFPRVGSFLLPATQTKPSGNLWDPEIPAPLPTCLHPEECRGPVTPSSPPFLPPPPCHLRAPELCKLQLGGGGWELEWSLRPALKHLSGQA